MYGVLYFKIITDPDLEFYYIDLVFWELIEEFFATLTVYQRSAARDLGYNNIVICLSCLDFATVMIVYVVIRLGIYEDIVYYSVDGIISVKWIILSFLFGYLNWNKI